MTREERVLKRLEGLETNRISVRDEPWIMYPKGATHRYVYKYRVSVDLDLVQKWLPAKADASPDYSADGQAWLTITGRFAELVKLSVLFK
jgi:hypothetical protein